MISVYPKHNAHNCSDGLEFCNSAVIDKNIDLAKTSNALFHKGIKIFYRGKIGLNNKSLGAMTLDLFGDFLSEGL